MNGIINKLVPIFPNLVVRCLIWVTMAGIHSCMLFSQPLNPLLQHQSLIQSNKDGSIQIGLVRLAPTTIVNRAVQIVPK